MLLSQVAVANHRTEGQQVLMEEGGRSGQCGESVTSEPSTQPLSFIPNQPGKKNVARNYETDHFGGLLIENKIHCSKIWLW